MKTSITTPSGLRLDTAVARAGFEAAGHIAKAVADARQAFPLPAALQAQAYAPKAVQHLLWKPFDMARSGFSKASQLGLIENSLLTWHSFNVALNQMERAALGTLSRESARAQSSGSR